MANQPVYPHDITKPYVWWLERGKIGIAYHNIEDGRSGKKGEFISPVVGYEAKIVANTLAFVDNGGDPDYITDSGEKFLEAGFENGMTVTVSGSSQANNNKEMVILTATNSTLSFVTGTVTAVVAGDVITISSGTGVSIRIYCSKRAEVIDRDASEVSSSGKFITSNLDDEPEYPEQFHEALVHYAIARGYELIPNKDALTMAQYWNGRYWEMLKKGKAFADGGQVYGFKKIIVNGTQGII